MKKLTDAELLLLDEFNITPNMWQDIGGDRPPAYENAAAFLSHFGFSGDEAYRIYDSLRDKLISSEEDCISLEDVATWVLDHYFTEEQLERMSPEEAIQFLQDWKYYFGFRKAEGMGEAYIDDALAVKRGELRLDTEDEEIFYTEKI